LGACRWETNFIPDISAPTEINANDSDRVNCNALEDRALGVVQKQPANVNRERFGTPVPESTEMATAKGCNPQSCLNRLGFSGERSLGKISVRTTFDETVFLYRRGNCQSLFFLARV
jgi:hypothetical protein